MLPSIPILLPPQQQQQLLLPIRSCHASIDNTNHGSWTGSCWHRLFVSCWWILVVVVVLPFPGTHAQDYTCDITTDACPTRENGVCESSWGTLPSNDPSCRDGDCLDCNYLCSQFNYNCTGCLSTTGCYWCPGDAICFNSPLYVTTLVNSTCVSASDYIPAPNPQQCTNTELIFSDPLFPAQEWIFEQINIYPVWLQNIYGTGVRVRINDDGIDGSIAELEGRLDENASCVEFAPLDEQAMHGTAVASIVGGQGNNGACGVGIAPGVILSSCNAFANQGTETFTDFDYQLDQFDISHNSIGVEACTSTDDETIIRQRRKLQDGCPFVDPEASPCEVCDFNATTTTPTTTPSDECQQAIISHCKKQFYRDELACLEFLDLLIGTSTCNYNLIPSTMLEPITEGVANGRDGKGAIFVFASGNEFQTGGDVNFGGLTNSRLTITVGAVGKDELHASYSTPGAAVMVSAPGGDEGYVSNQVTALPGGACSADAMGTSFAAPVVSGVIALLLEVNPDLTWRDVHGILAQTSRMITTDPIDTTRVTNAAGFTHSNFYGFGIIDANASVTAAQTWKLFCPEDYISVESGSVNVTLVDDGGSKTETQSITVTEADIIEADVKGDFIIESVLVLLDIQHFSRGDLEIVLTSPGGTSSILHPGDRPETTISAERWKLLTLRNWGEQPLGNWTLSIRDLRKGDLTDCVDAPFEARFMQNNVDCQFLATEGYCQDGAIVSDKFVGTDLIALLAFQYEGFALDEACCVCGGGFTTNDFVDQLRQWRMIIYGRSKSCDKNEDATQIVSDSPSLSPSLVPSNISMSPSGPSPMNGTTPSTTTTTTKSNQQMTSSKAKVDRQQRVITIVATIIAFLMIFGCVYCILRPDPNSKNRFAAKPTEQARDTGGGDFQNVHGEVA